MQLNSAPVESVCQVASASAPIGCHKASSAKADIVWPVTERMTIPIVSGQISL